MDLIYYLYIITYYNALISIEGYYVLVHLVNNYLDLLGKYDTNIPYNSIFLLTGLDVDFHFLMVGGPEEC